METLVVCDHSRVLLLSVEVLTQGVGVIIRHLLVRWDLVVIIGRPSGVSLGFSTRVATCMFETLESGTRDARHLLKRGLVSQVALKHYVVGIICNSVQGIE